MPFQINFNQPLILIILISSNHHFLHQATSSSQHLLILTGHQQITCKRPLPLVLGHLRIMLQICMLLMLVEMEV